MNRVRFITDQIIKSGKVTNSGRAYLGISPIQVTPQAQAPIRPPRRSRRDGLPGQQGSPAYTAGLRQGDIIVAVDAHAVVTKADLLDALSSLSPGQKTSLRVVGTNGKTRTVSVTLGTLPVPSAH